VSAQGVGARLARGPKWIIGFGPGLLVMLADTDVSSVVTAAQSGVQWGYRLLLLQFLLIPVLYAAQELAARLGLATGRGFIGLVEERYGRAIAMTALVALAVSCFAALLTQMGGLVGVGEMYGAHRAGVVGAALAIIIAMVWSKSYQRVERFAIVLGLFELAFLVAAWRSAPDGEKLVADMLSAPIGNHSFQLLVAANIGSAVIPWALVYQQSAVVEKGLGPRDVARVRIDTAAGVWLCQIITAAILVAAASALHSVGPDGLTSVGDIARALGDMVGPNASRAIFALGLSGSAMVATIVIGLALAWSLGEFSGLGKSTGRRPSEEPLFAAMFSCALALAGVLVLAAPGIVQLAIGAAALNAFLLPFVLYLIFRLARDSMAGRLRLRGIEAFGVAAVFVLTGALALVSGVAALLS
jgi:Mn2+/Fe2+ NRAMP family transporter